MKMDYCEQLISFMFDLCDLNFCFCLYTMKLANVLAQNMDMYYVLLLYD